jgi:hypothetical protein
MDPTNWDLKLPLIQLAINLVVNSSTGMTAFEAERGYNPRMSLDLPPEDPTELLRRFGHPTLAEAMKAQLAELRAVSDDEAARGKFYYDKRHKLVVYKPGDKVYLRVSHLPAFNSKLSPSKVGPLEVVEDMGRGNYRLRLPRMLAKMHDIVHGSFLTLYLPPREGQRVEEQPDPIDKTKKDVYELESVLKHKWHGRRKRFYFLVKWRGYDHSHDSWEPAENLTISRAAKTELRAYIRANRVPLDIDT